MPQFLRRLGSLTPRCRNSSAPVVPFTQESTDAASSPPTNAAAGDEARYGSPTARARVQAFGSPIGSAKKPRLCQSEENPHMVAATPTSSSKKHCFSEDRGAGLGGFMGSASPSSSKKPRLSPLNHTPRVATSPSQKTNRRLYDQSPVGAMTPAESPPGPEDSLPPPAMHSGVRSSASAICRPPVLPPNVGELPAYPQLSLNLQGINSSASDNSQPHRKQLEFENVDMAEDTKEPFSVRSSAPAEVFAAQRASSPSKADSQPKRPQTARPPARPLSGFLSGVVGRLMSPRRMMSPARVNSPRRDPCPPPPNSSPATCRKESADTPFQEDPSTASSKKASRGWFPSPRRREPTSSKPTEVGGEGASSAVMQTPRAQNKDLHRNEAADPVEALVQPMLSAVYGRALSSDEIAAATSACPEITWLAQCAILCPLPAGWVAIPAEESTGAPALYACELTGEVAEQPPHLPRFSKLARLLMHAVTHPAEAHTAVAWLKVEIEDANAECTRLQASWCRSIDPSSGSEFWHNPMTGKSSWDSPAAPSAFTAAVAERVLDTEPFKAVRAREVAQSRASSMTPRPPQEARSKSQSAPSSRQRAGSKHAPVSSSRGYRTDDSDMTEQPMTQPAHRRSYHEHRSRDVPSSRYDRADMSDSMDVPQSARRRSSHEKRSRDAPSSARYDRADMSDSMDMFEQPMVQSARRRSSHEQRPRDAPLSARHDRANVHYEEEAPCRRRASHERSRDTSVSARGRRKEVFDLYEEDAPKKSSRRKEPTEHRSKPERPQRNRGEVFDLFEETPTPANRKRSQRASAQRDCRETSSSEEETAEPEVFNMATPPRKEATSSQANSTDAVSALAGAAAALATAAAALSARGPPKDESMDTSMMSGPTAIPSIGATTSVANSPPEKPIPSIGVTMSATISSPEKPSQVLHQDEPMVSSTREETSEKLPPKAQVYQVPETNRMLQFSDIQAAPFAPVPQKEHDTLADHTVQSSVAKLAPPPPPPPMKPRAKTPAPPPPTEKPQVGIEAAIVSAARGVSASSDSEGESERKEVLHEVDSILLSARGPEKPKSIPSASVQADSSFSLSFPSGAEQAKSTPSDVATHEKQGNVPDPPLSQLSVPSMPAQEVATNEKQENVPAPPLSKLSVPSMPTQATPSEMATHEKQGNVPAPPLSKLSVPSMPTQAKPKTSEIASTEKSQNVVDSDASKPDGDKKPSPVPKIKLPTSLPSTVGIKGKGVPGIPPSVIHRGGS